MPTPSTLPLASNFAARLDALRTEAAGGGHSDLDHILEMAITIAQRRIDAQAIPPALVDSEILRPVLPSSGSTDQG